MSGIVNVQDFGQQLDVTTIKRGLRELNPSLHFDPGARLGLYHPMMDTRQGVWLNDTHICTLDRGPIVPEHSAWAMTKRFDGTRERSHIVRVGWRDSFHTMVLRGVPGVTWPSLCRKFRVEDRVFRGGLRDLASAQVEV